MSKGTLYTFNLSVWSAVPELALVELGYTDAEITKKVVNLVEGENFAPAFLKINPKATLPTLQTTSGETYTSTATVTKYLINNSPSASSVALGTDIIDKVHEDQYDPNFAMLSAVRSPSSLLSVILIELQRNEEELKEKAAGFPALFTRNRQQALTTHSQSPLGQPFKTFYTDKLAGNGGLLAIYESKVPANTTTDFFTQSQAHWANIKSFIYDILPAALTGTQGPFLGGSKPGEDDFHVGGWLAHIVSMIPGSHKGVDGIKVLKEEFGGDVPESVVSYWNAWSGRESWGVVYAEGLH
ncbi:hypothetical protein JAAARDRAFT_627073 [Jaapia argillacea MUCL 33604]|uniref:GST N-terminal domain-containing protein n=1 Tax=Jaapia argillacea MUCL 33604 TaxID=933084 RepID=A0A067PXR5_9AGAM|nr:hypothetical protein JAAARDRAFT_627073 [Jaapia argillacea MUCL 33604]